MSKAKFVSIKHKLFRQLYVEPEKHHQPTPSLRKRANEGKTMCEHEKYVEYRWVKGQWNLYRKDCLSCSKTLAFGMNKNPIEREKLRASFENAIPLRAEN